MKPWYSLGRTCPECGIPVSDGSKSGLCRTHFNKKIAADPEIQARKGKTLAKHMAADPLLVAKRKEASRRAAKTRWANPEYAAKTRKRFIEEVQPKSLEPQYHEARVRAALASSRKRLEWCAPEYRDLYRTLINRKGYRKAEAKPMILEMMAKDRAREMAKLSPFERQELALKRGAKLVANDAAPSLTNPANYGEERWKVGTAA